MATKASAKVSQYYNADSKYNALPGARMRVRITFLEELLGTASNNKDIHREFIASKAPNAESVEEEVAFLGVEGVVEKSMTVFPKMEGGVPYLYDYQWKGFFKDSCGMLKRVAGSESAKIKAYKKEIDGLIFVEDRKVPLEFDAPMGECQRPLRAQTAQGERISLANSETVPAGATCEFTIICMKPDLMKVVKEWLSYGVAHGTGQWRNSGKGRFTWEELDSWTV